MKHSALGRTRMLGVKMDAEEYHAAEDLAAKHGLTLSDLTRALLTAEHLCRELQRLLDSDRLADVDQQTVRERFELITHILEERQRLKAALDLMDDVLGPVVAELEAVLRHLAGMPLARK
jgi:hypothetical protein